MNERLSAEFEAKYHKPASYMFFSPGRVNLIGEHIDYNGGLVMPCAITFGTYMLLAENNEGVFRFKSLNFDEELTIPLQSGYQKTGESWYNYPLGVIHHFLQDGHQLRGVDMLFYGDIPIGSGLSSSASIEVVTGYALNELFNTGYNKLELVKLAKAVENIFIGVNCGIMDQFAVAFGETDKALMLNCQTLDYQAVDCNLDDHLLAIINTNKPRKLAESKYNERVQECAMALVALQKELDVTNLCQVDPDTFKDKAHLIKNQVVKNRAKHVIEENYRVKQAARALSNHQLAEFGRLMYASHDSLRDLYEVSGKELDAVVAYSRSSPHVAGARMTGAGFGGCAIALVKKDAFKSYSDGLTAYYTRETGYAPSVYSSLIGNGVGGLLLPVDCAEYLYC